ncbi:Sulfotransferase family protein [compost metagenome]
MLQRFLWKLLPKSQRTFLLSRLPVLDRQAVNKSMSGSIHFPEPFRQRSCLFIHIPKCAGNSICSALFEGWYPGHLPLYWYQLQFPEEFSQSFKFAFVRDPLERAYSAYVYLKDNPQGRRDVPAQQMLGRYRDFDQFVSKWLDADNVRRILHFTPQVDFLVDSMGHLAMDFIGYQENLDQDFETVCRHFGLQLQLPHINASKRSGEAAQACCSVRTRRLVRRVYQRDYELLGYE